MTVTTTKNKSCATREFYAKREGTIRGEPSYIELKIYKHLPGNHRDYDTLQSIDTPYYSVSIVGTKGRSEGGQLYKFYTEDDVSESLKDIFRVWESYHLNDLQAGTHIQMNALNDPEFIHEDNHSWYDDACEYLKKKGIYIDRGYTFGYEWLVKVLSDDELSYIKSLFMSSTTQHKGDD